MNVICMLLTETYEFLLKSTDMVKKLNYGKTRSVRTASFATLSFEKRLIFRETKF